MMHSRLHRYFENPSDDDPRMKAVRKSIVESAQETLAQRVSIPWEVANTVAYLCTDACSYIYGQMIMNGAVLPLRNMAIFERHKINGGSKNCFRRFIFIL